MEKDRRDLGEGGEKPLTDGANNVEDGSLGSAFGIIPAMQAIISGYP